MKTFFLALVLSVWIPGVVQAATFSFAAKDPIGIGETFMMRVEASAETPLNVLDAGIMFDPDHIEVVDISTGGSVFTLWTRQPVFSNTTGRIYFTGGSAQGWKGEGMLLTIVVKAKKAGVSDLVFTDATIAYRADGKGTPEESVLRPYRLTVREQPSGDAEWEGLLDADKEPPQSLRVAVGNSPYMFDNRYFLSISAVDAGSGVDYYEVTEGENLPVVAESLYVLKDQTLKQRIAVTAVDKAGNKKTVVQYPYMEAVLLKIVLSILLVIALFFAIRTRHARF